MKNVLNTLTASLLFTLTFSCVLSAQEFQGTPEFEVHKVYPYTYTTESTLQSANNLSDLDQRFQTSWVKAYRSVEVIASRQGNLEKAVGDNEMLTQEQKSLISSADPGTEILVNIEYIPENSLQHNDVKQYDFSFSVEPEQTASYAGGEEALRKYLNETAMNKIPTGSFTGFDLSAIKFTVNEEGQIVNAHVFKSVYLNSGNEQIENLLLQAINQMPAWNPATFTNGVKTSQDFVLTVGNQESCAMNLLDIQRN